VSKQAPSREIALEEALVALEKALVTKKTQGG
jgi:hypothetical protein